jgi:hypothetical protein
MIVPSRSLVCDVAVIGGGLGGVAAALAAAEAGRRVVLTEQTDWLGGQISSQGVSALDEHPYIERFGGTRSYMRLRDSIRAQYRRRGMPATMPDGAPLNPGDGWVSRLCFEPRAGLAAIESLLAAEVAAGRITILLEHRPVAATVENDRVVEVLMQNVAGAQVAIRAAFVLDATELGELLPLTGAEYVTGAESRSETGEPSAPLSARPDETQGFTFCFAVEHRPGEQHTIPRPPDYERFRDQQPYTLVLRGHHGEERPFRVFTHGPTGLPPFWTYRRIVSGALLDPPQPDADLALINWSSNDYHWATLLDRAPDEQAAILDEARRLALGFLHWLQTEAPRDDGDYGYPGLRLRPDVMGSADGLSKYPYIRESRRIRALKRIVEQEIAAEGRDGARAAHFRDSVGVGWYHIDLHDCVGNPRSMYAPTLPFQIPLGALIPQRLSNLIAACKNIGTTHLTNGAYRLHPIEWNIGEAAGALAAFCCAIGCGPHDVAADEALLLRLQYRLLSRGVPLCWTIDLPDGHPLFVPAQLLVAAGAIPTYSPRADRLAIEPEQPLTHSEARAMLEAAARLAQLPAVEFAEVQPDRSVRREELAAALQSFGLDADLRDPPNWGATCAALAPLILRAVRSAEEKE